MASVEAAYPATESRLAFSGAALVPGMPHLLAEEPAASWAELADATRQVGERLRAAGPDALIVLSTQWFTVLGHQLQMEPRLSGTRVDENWYAYDYGTLNYDLQIDSELTEQWAQEIEARGYQARRTRYTGFPIDTGIVVAHQLLDPEREIPLALVSCNLYAQAEDLGAIAAAAIDAASSLERRVALVAVSGLSSALTQRWIDPAEDRIEDPGNERWDRLMLDLLAGARVEEALALREQYAREAQVDSQFRALAFLAGSNFIDGAASVLAYGPVWGTGAAVVYWPEERSDQ
jgi:2-aminophenol/2-amino-5-chlorophenol 1,6-dioxygenase alpha subunit